VNQRRFRLFDTTVGVVKNGRRERDLRRNTKEKQIWNQTRDILIENQPI